MESTPKKYGFQQLNEEIFQSNIKSSIKSKIFLGEFREKRYCDELKDYRDLVVIDKRAEAEIFKDFEGIQEQINEFYKLKEIPFFGFTAESPEDSITSLFGSAKTFSLWTELESELAFGKYWFSVKSVRFRDTEISIKLKCLRTVSDSDKSTSFSEKFKAKKQGQNDSNDSNEEDLVEQWKFLFDVWKRDLNESLLILMSSLNRRNLVEVFKFIAFLMFSLVTFSITSIKFIGIFTIKFMEQLNIFVHVCTPFFLAVIDLISKIWGAFFILISMIWRDSTQPRRPPPPAQRPLPIQYGYNR